MHAISVEESSVAWVGDFPYRPPKEIVTYYPGIVSQHGQSLIIDDNTSDAKEFGRVLAAEGYEIQNPPSAHSSRTI
jgi:hypothetical protein